LYRLSRHPLYSSIATPVGRTAGSGDPRRTKSRRRGLETLAERRADGGVWRHAPNEEPTAGSGDARRTKGRTAGSGDARRTKGRTAGSGDARRTKQIRNESSRDQRAVKTNLAACQTEPGPAGSRTARRQGKR